MNTKVVAIIMVTMAAIVTKYLVSYSVPIQE